MDNISLSIPFLVLSTEMKISGETEKHILTPFGYMDIILPLGTDRSDDVSSPEILVVGDIDSWMLDESMPGEFKSTLLGFVKEITRTHLGCSSTEPWPGWVRFMGAGRDVRFSWDGMPSGEDELKNEQGSVEVKYSYTIEDA